MQHRHVVRTFVMQDTILLEGACRRVGMVDGLFVIEQGDILLFSILRRLKNGDSRNVRQQFLCCLHRLLDHLWLLRFRNHWYRSIIVLTSRHAYHDGKRQNNHQTKYSFHLFFGFSAAKVRLSEHKTKKIFLFLSNVSNFETESLKGNRVKNKINFIIFSLARVRALYVFNPCHRCRLAKLFDNQMIVGNNVAATVTRKCVFAIKRDIIATKMA